MCFFALFGSWENVGEDLLFIVVPDAFFQFQPCSLSLSLFPSYFVFGFEESIGDNFIVVIVPSDFFFHYYSCYVNPLWEYTKGI